MRKQRSDWGTLYIGHGCEHDVAWYYNDSFLCQNFLAFIMFNRGFFPIWHVWSEQKKQEFTGLITVFDGHADHVNDEWRMCAEGKYDRPVQDFVNEHDGHAMLILLKCCNARDKGRVTSQKSLVIYSRSAMSARSMESRRSRQLIHVPGHGDFIGTTQEAELNAIAEQLGYVPAFT